MTAAVVWRYDARDYARNPELCPVFIEPPVFVWAPPDEPEDDDPATE